MMTDISLKNITKVIGLNLSQYSAIFLSKWLVSKVRLRRYSLYHHTPPLKGFLTMLQRERERAEGLRDFRIFFGVGI